MLPSAEFNEKAMQLALDLRYTTTSNAEIFAKALHSLGAGLIDEMEAADRDHRAKQVAAFRQQIHLARDNSRHALRLRPDADLYYAMSHIYQQQQRLGDVHTAYEQPLKRDPAYRRAYQRMAITFALLGGLTAPNRAL